MSENYYRNTPNNIINCDLTVSIIQKHDATKFHASFTEYKPTPLERLTQLAKKYNVDKMSPIVLISMRLKF